jgi:hypothetical protein
MTSLAQSPDLRDIAGAKNEDGTWKYPKVREDLELLKSNHISDLFHMEQRAIMAEDVSDSLAIDLKVQLAANPRTPWYRSFEAGVVLGSALVVLSGWAIGQAAN